MNKLRAVKKVVWLMPILAITGCAMLHHGPSAKAKLAPTQGNTANGIVTFTQHDSKVIVDADIAGLAPGLHGFHIHEKGDCSAADATSAGGHFNPTHQPHGDPSGHAHHAGDLPMLNAGADGRAKLHVEVDWLALQGDQSAIGKAVVVHQKMDDFTSQPAGNSGARVACGVIMAE
jgi:Cu-Zn family superoxide dismutase